MLLLTSIVFLVILVEFDPEGASAKQPQNAVSGTLLEDANTYFLETASGSRLPLLRMERPRIPVGSPIYAYRLPGTDNAIAEFDLPHAPRSTSDLLTVIGVLLLCMIMVAGDPRVAYFDIFDDHA